MRCVCTAVCVGIRKVLVMKRALELFSFASRNSICCCCVLCVFVCMYISMCVFSLFDLIGVYNRPFGLFVTAGYSRVVPCPDGQTVRVRVGVST